MNFVFNYHPSYKYFLIVFLECDLNVYLHAKTLESSKFSKFGFVC